MNPVPGEPGRVVQRKEFHAVFALGGGRIVVIEKFVVLKPEHFHGLQPRLIQRVVFVGQNAGRIEQRAVA